jgi:predicted ABC-type sugar transport system permease subunit
MKFPSGNERDTSWFLLAAATLVLASPLRHLWAGDGRAWYAPFLVWIAIIVAVRLLGRRGDGADRDR